MLREKQRRGKLGLMRKTQLCTLGICFFKMFGLKKFSFFYCLLSVV